MKTAIVTGANGFIGNALVRELVSREVFVYAVVRNKEKCANLHDLKNIVIIECEMSQYKNISCYINEKDIDSFYHFAWDGTVGDNRSNYALQLKNVEFTCDAVKSAKEMNVKKFIFAGSIIEYEYEKCITENYNNIGINNIYGIGKITARNMAQVLSNSIGIDFITTIISNVYGVGEISDRLLKSTLKKMLKREKTLFTTCEQFYDFIYIDDAAYALYLIGEYGENFRNYYIGNKEPKKLKEYIIQMRDCIDKNIELGFGEITYKGVSLTYKEFDTYSLYNNFKFEPRISFNEGIRKTIEWLKSTKEE